MPHDISGKELKSGDPVLIRATVISVNDGSEYCNITVETNEVMYPGKNKTTIILNTRQVEKIVLSEDDSPCVT